MENPHILLVSDNTDYAEHLVEELLPEAGYRVSLAGNHPPPEDIDLVLVSVDRVLVSPLAGLQAQRRQGCHAAAVLLAPRLSDAMASQLFELNVRDFLTKPATDQNLLEKVRNVLDATSGERGQAQMAGRLQVQDEALRRRLEELDALSRIGRVLTTADDVDTVLTRIVEAAVYLTHAEEGALFLADDGGQLYLRAEKNLGQRQAQILSTPSQDSIAMHVYQSGQPVLRASNAAEAFKVKTGYLVQALVNVPIVSGAHTIGVLAVYSHSVSSFEETDVTTLNVLSDYTVLALRMAESVTRLNLQAVGESDSSQRVFYHTDEMDSPIESIEVQLQSLLAGGLGPLNQEQTDALRRIGLAVTRLSEISAAVRRLALEHRSEAGNWAAE